MNGFEFDEETSTISVADDGIRFGESPSDGFPKEGGEGRAKGSETASKTSSATKSSKRKAKAKAEGMSQAALKMIQS